MKTPTEYSVFLPIKRGSKGKDVRLVQEWLCLHACVLRADGEYGPATEATVRKFQTKAKLTPTGIVDEETFRALIAPMTRACKPLATTAATFAQRVVAAARVHLKEHPREVGGQNRGPWVRLYTGGHEGEAWPWCAAFVSFLMRQAAEDLKDTKVPIPIKGSASCDVLVAQAREKELFVPETLIATGSIEKSRLVPGSIFVVRNPKNAKDWIHTGIVANAHDEYIETIEGNTNDEGSREGYEVCKRSRGYRNLDFIVFP